MSRIWVLVPQPTSRYVSFMTDAYLAGRDGAAGSIVYHRERFLNFPRPMTSWLTALRCTVYKDCSWAVPSPQQNTFV